jgi:FkbM family methyltransferase
MGPLPILKRWLRKKGHQIGKRLVDWSKISGIEERRRERGFLQYWNSDVSGEGNFLRYILPALSTEAESKIALDIGANCGDYAAELLRHNSGMVVYAFEPHPITFQKLLARLGSDERVRLVNAGLGLVDARQRLYDYADNQGSGHASIYESVLINQHRAKATESWEIEIINGRDYLARTAVTSVFFAKIDVEGHELQVLKGLGVPGDDAFPKVIQFEFNEMNIESRTFLRDFYDYLPDYKFFRLGSDFLIDLGPYNPRNEVFVFQNIVAIQDAFEFLVRKWTRPAPADY